jgi:parvulin-like peptidyl-prolyl isomerase
MARDSGSPFRLTLMGVGAVLLVFWCQSPARAQGTGSDYENRVVAFLEGGEIITRQDLGEYLLARMGAARIQDFIDRKLVFLAGKEGGVEVLDAEVDAALTDAMQGLPRERFIKEIIRGYYGQSLYEWKEDRLRPKLVMSKLCRNQLRYTEDEIRRAFEATYGERVLVRMIIWPKEKEAEAQKLYGQLRDSDDFFNETARHQQPRSDLASAGGKLKPMGRYSTGDDTVEQIAFSLKPGQVSELIQTRDGKADQIVLLKCDGRLPADTTANLDAKRAELVQMVLDQKLKAEVPKKMAELKGLAKPQLLITDWTLHAEASQVIAKLGTGVPVLREEFAEFLIERYGAEKLEMLSNSRIILRACLAKGITVSPQDIDASLEQYVKARNITKDEFEKKILRPNGQSMYEFREDFLRPELMMTKLVRPQLKATEEEIKLAYDAYYGEKVEVLMILYPRGEEKLAMQEYAQLRDSEDAFNRKARMQASSKLASMGGKLPPIGRNTTGSEELEREIFSLNPGECSRLVGSPEGTVLVRCVRRIVPEKRPPLADVRPQLIEDILQRKLKTEVPRAVAELRKVASPRLLIKDPNRPEDVTTSAEHELQQAGYIKPAPKK